MAMILKTHLETGSYYFLVLQEELAADLAVYKEEGWCNKETIPDFLLNKSSLESVFMERSIENHHLRIYCKGCVFLLLFFLSSIGQKIGLLQT